MNQSGLLIVVFDMSRFLYRCLQSRWPREALFSFFVLHLIGCATTREWSSVVNQPQTPLAPVSVSPMSAELEFDALADGQRLKLDGVWVSQGPDRFRLELRSPTGGAIFAMATDGQQITCYDARANRFFVGAALPRSFDLLLPMAPMKLEASQWLELLMGAMKPPEQARYQLASDGGFRAEFSQGENEIRTTFDSRGYVETVEVLAEQGDVKVTYGKRDAQGRSLETLIEDANGAYRMRMRLRDIRESSGFRDKIFSVRQPSAAEKIAL